MKRGGHWRGRPPASVVDGRGTDLFHTRGAPPPVAEFGFGILARVVTR